MKDFNQVLNMKKMYIGLLTACCLLPMSLQAKSSYPEQAIRLIVPFTPGGGNDVFARTVAQPMGKLLGQSVIVENRPGASGAIGAAAVGRSMPADGYTILLSEVSIHSVNGHLRSNLTYDAEKDLSPVAKAGTYDYMLVVNPKKINAQTLDELVEIIKKSTAKKTYGVPGIGTPHHLGMELFAMKAGLEMTPVAYRGASPAVQDLLSGEIDLMLSDRAAVRSHIKAGTLKAIAVAGSQRVKEFPGIPTIAESGIKDFAMESWFGLSVRSGTPDAIIDKLAQTYAEVIKDPEIIARLSEAGINVTFASPKEFSTFIKDETKRWGALIQERNIKIE